ncbi:ImmA/IrrE family metallo-endopeptidase [Listeria booriae]|uniref:ImmA/IrrE family metallo-endopeptidase n=1 Tax=Listeria booriae TaxID=1552123 RepID=UPI001623A2F8|nr:ImmA/IrrE family metallo-endopeptidase [Listeria booriae]MBC2149535.1 ImmA/IrrE family metallo-endopeptidase [Listeria booriae]
MDYGKIKKSVIDLIEKCGSSDPFRIAKHLGCNIIYADLSEENFAFKVYSNRCATIVLNENKSEEEHRYSCAHEIMHVLFHRGVNTPFLRKQVDGLGIPRMEKEANFGAFVMLIANLDADYVAYFTKSQLLRAVGLSSEFECFVEKDFLD